MCLRSLRKIAIGKRGLLEKGPFQKHPFSRDSREVGVSRDAPDCGKQRRIRPSLEILENFKTLQILEIPPVKRPFRSGPFPVPKKKKTNWGYARDKFQRKDFTY